MSRRGFTLVEALIALVIVGVLLALALPRAGEWVRRERLRGARRQLITYLAQARTTAVYRGCQAVLHLDQSRAQVWVTACALQGVATDTVGNVDDLANRYGISFQSDGDSLTFTPQGLAFATASIHVVFIGEADSAGLTITPAGRPVW